MPDFHGLPYFYITKFGEFDIFSHNSYVITLIYRSVGLVIIMFAFKLRVLCTFLEHIYKGTVQIPQGLL